jgi:glutamate:Na+ symporter, ESS family
VLTLDLVQTLAFGGLVLFLGYGIRRAVPPLARYNIPAPVVGGLLVAAVSSAAQYRGVTLVEFDTTLQPPLMIAFFTSIGFGASLALLRVGGPLVLLFFIVSSIGAVAQNLLGVGCALLVGQPPLLGVLAGSVTLTGGRGPGSPSRRSSRRPACPPRRPSRSRRRWWASSRAGSSGDRSARG